MGAVNWPALARAIVARRIEIGHDTQKALAKASEISLRTISDLEAGERGGYTASTLAKLEKALEWPPGRIQTILDGAEPSPGSELSTPEGIARYLFRDDLPLVALLHRAALPDAALFRLILHVRAVRERDNAALLKDLAERVRAAGGWAPEQPYPPTWLIEEDS